MSSGIRRNRFTPEQVEVLRAHPYVRYVCEESVSFTADFKEEFWRLYNEDGMAPYDILSHMGLDYHMLGSSRVQGIANYIKRQFRRDGCFKGVRSAASPANLADKQEIARLKAEIEYLRQEHEFLKKIISAEKGAKSK